MSHTPGPFAFSDVSHDGAYSVRNVEGHRVCLAYTHDDARLFAASPDLLAACEQAADTFADFAIALRFLQHDTAANAAQIAEQATRAAIAKAKGEQP